MYEGDETVMLNLSATSGAGNVMGLPISRELTITEFNDAPPTLTLTGPSMVSENNVDVVFMARLDGVLEDDLELELVVVGGDAVVGDYTTISNE